MQFLQTDHNTNFQRHLKEWHCAEFTAASEKNKKSAKRPSCDELEQSSLSEYGFISKKINVSLSFSDLLIAALKYVTIDGRPFEIDNDAGFLHLTEPNLKALPGPKRRLYR